MKKTLIVASLLALTSLAFGQDLKLSAGGLVGYSQNNVSMSLTASPIPNMNSELKIGSTDALLSFGGFVETSYFGANVALQTSIGKMQSTVESLVNGASVLKSESTVEPRLLNLAVGLYGKFPFEFGAASVFPIAGASYVLNLDAKGKKDFPDDQKADLNDFLVNLGVGGDYAVTEALYIRGLASFDWNLTYLPKSMKDQADQVNGKTNGFGYALSFSLGLGYRF